MLLDATREYHTLPDAIERYPILLDATWPYPMLSTISQRYSTRRRATWCDLYYSTLPYATQRCSTLLDATIRYPTLPETRLPDATRWYPTLPTLPDSALPDARYLKNATLKKLSKLSYAFRRFQTLPDAALMLLNATLRHAAPFGHVNGLRVFIFKRLSWWGSTSG